MLTRRQAGQGIAASLVALAGGHRVFSAEPTRAQVKTQTIRSADGTIISFAVVGRGPPLVFLHESLESGREWLAVAQALADGFTCCAVDRRGRGSSGPAGNHSLVRECEDAEAVLRHAGNGATLMGASYGAIVALETALRFPVHRLIVYEPPLSLTERSFVHRALETSFESYEELAEAGRLDEALVLGLKAFAGMPAEAVAEFKTSSPDYWQVMRNLVPTWVPEMRAVRALPPGIERYRALQSPALLISGSESPGFLREVIDALATAIPDARRFVVEGHGHEAHVTAPALLAGGIRNFLRSVAE
jgi:pimeloyl-ACP methyl ester carboxylesterase